MGSTSGAVMGRPRTFDLDIVLDRALRVFWEHGYEGSTLMDLTGAMGITKTSMYAAFGNKEQLFRKVLDRYTAGPASYGEKALAEPTARAVVEHWLHGAARATTLPDSPHGCLGVQAALVSGEGAQGAHDVLVAWRQAGGTMLEERFRRAAREGDLPGEIDPVKLARYVMTVAFGIAVQAATGVGREELDEVADMALGSLRLDCSA